MKIISYNLHKKLMKKKTHECMAEIVILQRDMAYQFIKNNRLDEKYHKWFMKQLGIK